MGMDPGTLALIAAAIGAIGKVGESAFAPSPFQPHESFRNTAADPVSALSEVQSNIKTLLADKTGHLSDPLLPNANIPSIPSFTGGGLPHPIGVNPAPSRLTFENNPDTRNEPSPRLPGFRPGVTRGPGGTETPPPDPSAPPTDLTPPPDPTSRTFSLSARMPASGMGATPPPGTDPQLWGALQLLIHAQKPGALA